MFDFEVPATFLGQNVHINFTIPIPDNQGNVGFAGARGVLRSVVPGALLLLTDKGQEVLIPKMHVQSLVRVGNVQPAAAGDLAKIISRS